MPLLAAAPRDFPPPAPSPPPSITRSFTMTSVLYFFCPDSLSSQELVRSAPSMYTVRPFLRYSPAISAVRPKAVRLCHSVWSCQFPSLSFLRSLVAKLNFATAMPPGVYFTSGSFPRLPTRMTLFTPRAMVFVPSIAKVSRQYNRIAMPRHRNQ